MTSKPSACVRNGHNEALFSTAMEAILRVFVQTDGRDLSFQ